MAKKNTGESKRGYFKRIFKENPNWLDEKSNSDVLTRYKKDHGIGNGEELDKSIANSLTNTKSSMRKEMRKEGTGVLGRTIKVTGVKGASRPPLSLQVLEEVIDDALTMARNFGLEKEHHVVLHLRAARNGVVWMEGEK